MGAMLLLCGIAVAGASVAIGAAFIAALSISKRRLNAKLDAEYGKKAR